MSPTGAPPAGRRIAATAWTAATVSGAAAAWRHDRIAAIGAEALALPLAVVLCHAVLVGAVALALRSASERARHGVLAGCGVAMLGYWGAALGTPAERAPVAASAAVGPDLVLITLDTFRADHLGALGGVDLTPNLDAFAADATLFTQAVTTAPLTGPAHASMLTGLDARSHGLGSNGETLAAETIVGTLAERGWATGAFVTARVLDRHTGLQRGFHHYDDRFVWTQRLAWLPGLGDRLDRGPGARPGDVAVDRAIDWLDRQDGPAFLWVHLYDAHMPYEPPPDFAPDPASLAAAREADREARRDAGRELISRVEAAHVHEGKLMYAAEVRYVDALVGRLLERVDDDAVVIVVADHGESHDEHGYFFNHGALLHEPALRVPLIVRWPGRLAPGRADGLVSVADVAGTLLAAAGVDAEPLGAETAHDAVLAWTPGQQNRRSLGVVGRRRPQQTRVPGAAWRFDHGKLVTHDGSPVTYYDLAADPGETTGLVPPGERIEQVDELERMVQEPTDSPTDEERARLESLGYVD